MKKISELRVKFW